MIKPGMMCDRIGRCSYCSHKSPLGRTCIFDVAPSLSPETAPPSEDAMEYDGYALYKEINQSYGQWDFWDCLGDDRRSKWNKKAQEIAALTSARHDAWNAGYRAASEKMREAAAQWHDEQTAIAKKTYNELKSGSDRRAASYAFSSYVEHEKSAAYFRALPLPSRR